MQTEKCQNANIEYVSKKSFSMRVVQTSVQLLRNLNFFLFTRALKNSLGIKKYYSGDKKIGSSISIDSTKQTNKIVINEGDRVRIKSREEIIKTLNERNKLEGCFFMQEMFNYCGTEQIVLRKIEHFYDESTSTMKKARTTYLLEGLHCSGKLTGYPIKCDRYCYSFWKEVWLEKVELLIITFLSMDITLC